MNLTPEKLTEATAAGFDLIAAMLESVLPTTDGTTRGGPDPRLIVLRNLVKELAPVPPPVTCCPRCALEIAKMVFHPTDNMNICPRCSTPLRG